MRSLSLVFVALALALVCVGQGPDTGHQSPRGVVRLRVRVKVGEATRGLARKRFYLVKGSLEQNKNLFDATERRAVVSRDCYYRDAGASEALINWLKESDCESVYCREIQPADLEGQAAVPEFQNAVAAGMKEFGSEQTARRWLTVNLPEKLRSGFYLSRQTDLNELVKQAEASSGAKVISVMTDRNGTAYFTDLEPGTYVVSNLLATEIGSSSASWNCEIQVKPGDLATEKPFLISNRKDKSVKCVAVEKPLPACAAKPN